MRNESAPIATTSRRGDETVPLMLVGTVLLRHRRLVGALAVFGALSGIAAALLIPPRYRVTATFIPEGNDMAAASGLALAASQLGIKVPKGDNSWGPPIYVELLQSRDLLGPIATDTAVRFDVDGRRATLADLLKAKGKTPALRDESAIRNLAKVVTATEDKRLNAVRLVVRTKWPTVSFSIADRLVRAVNQFNLQSRQSMANAERLFVDGQAADAERALRESEDRLQDFLQQNRMLNSSPQLTFMRERLQRDVTLHQQMYTSLVQNKEEARLRAVRATPVITIIQAPKVPVLGEPRGLIRKTLLGIVAGTILGGIAAFLLHGLGTARQDADAEAREFFTLVEEATPRFLRRSAR